MDLLIILGGVIAATILVIVVMGAGVAEDTGVKQPRRAVGR